MAMDRKNPLCLLMVRPGNERGTEQAQEHDCPEKEAYLDTLRTTDLLWCGLALHSSHSIV